MSIHDHPYGVGIAYRYNLHEETLHFADEIDLLEIPTVDHIVRRRALSYPGAQQKFAQILERFPCLAHGIAMSIGSVEPLDDNYFKTTRRLLDETGMRVFSEHLAFQRMDGKDIQCFLGMPQCEASLKWLERNYNRARNRLGRPFALENISLSFQVPDAEYTEPQYLAEFLKRTDATLLLDVTNLYNNCTNFNQDPLEYLHALPPDRISQMHLAGGHYADDGFLNDCHGYNVMDEVWDLYREALRHTKANIVILERDYRYHPFRDVMNDVRKAREIFYELRPESPPETPELPAIEPAVSNGESDFEAEEFRNLRSFQRAILKAITDDDFRRNAAANISVVTDTFPMDEDWLDRFRRCQKLDDKAAGWKETERLDREDEERLRRWEWSQWAART